MAKILVVDDESDLELLIKQKFRKKIRENIYEFLFAQNGEDALQKISDNPDLGVILSDINMPVMDGLTAAKLIKSNEQIKNIPLIVLTATISKESEEQFDGLCEGCNYC